MALADLVVLMNAGRIEQTGTPREVFNQPRTAFVARFMGGHNVIPASGGAVAIRSDRLMIQGHGDLGTGDRGTGARVTEVEYQGAWIQANLLADDGTELVSLVPEAVYDSMPFYTGDRVSVHWDPASAHRLAS